MIDMVDICHAFVPGEMVSVLPNQPGKLSSLTFAVKELYDVKGFVTGSGNLHWKSTHSVADKTAPAVEMLLNNGATMLGKTISDEMAFSLDGENVHYGTALNPNCTNRIPGGSSSGSASAVAGGIVDFALGTDTAGSIRVPASYCGIYGYRPTHGLISTAGIHPLAPSFDVVGWFSKSLNILMQVGSVLLDLDLNVTSGEVAEIALPTIFIEQLKPETRKDFLKYTESLPYHVSMLDLEDGVFSELLDILRNIQWWELNYEHGDWIRENIDTFGEEIRGRLEQIHLITKNDVEKFRAKKSWYVDYLNSLLPHNRLFMFPTVHDIAPLKGRPIPERRAFRSHAMKSLCLATVAGLPQISMPILEYDSCPLGISLLGARGSDANVLKTAMRLVKVTSLD